jgi:hypothetical protein
MVTPPTLFREGIYQQLPRLHGLALGSDVTDNPQVKGLGGSDIEAGKSVLPQEANCGDRLEGNGIDIPPSCANCRVI